MAYSDAEMRIFTAIAHLDMTDEFNRLSEGGTKPVSIKDMNLSQKDLDMLKEKNVSLEDIEDYCIAAVHDKDSENGFFGCVIQTSPTEAAMAFRSSEQLDKDYLIADLVDPITSDYETAQQAEVREFLESSKDVLNRYESVSSTGHSLGGNLAETAAILYSEYVGKDNLTSCTSFDGPGFSQSFIDSHREQIAKVIDKLTGYTYSPVGKMFYTLPGRKTVEIEVIDDLKDEIIPFSRHDTPGIKFDENGNVIPRKPGATSIGDVVSDLTSQILHNVTKDMVNDHADEQNLETYVAEQLMKMLPNPFIPMIPRLLPGILKSIRTIKKSLRKNEKVEKNLAESARPLSPFTGASSGGADRIMVSTDEMEDCIQKYQAERQKLVEALETVNEAAKELEEIWVGPACLAYMARLAEARKNITQAEQKIDDAVEELRFTIKRMKEAESNNIRAASSLSVGSSPFL